MTATEVSHHSVSTDAWTWWQARRLRYNLALAAAGWIAYGLNVAEFYAFHHPIWKDWQGAVSMTGFLGIAFLVLMGVANVCFLLGPLTESWVRPDDIDRYRRNAFAAGFGGSMAVPFLFPGANLFLLIGQSAG